ncbi:hypothetical protein [Sporomusa sp. GT1]|uniref:hypothetical protein n=1 Tax=Sporomusa sp. GT1 TaxID=1534747 RepID=UPI00166D7E28|nr:hypothetical protein [Sporomusa sp. GT1]
MINSHVSSSFRAPVKKPLTVLTTASIAETRTAVMHKRRLSASGAALYDGRPRRALHPAPFVL